VATGLAGTRRLKEPSLVRGPRCRRHQLGLHPMKLLCTLLLVGACQVHQRRALPAGSGCQTATPRVAMLRTAAAPSPTEVFQPGQNLVLSIPWGQPMLAAALRKRLFAPCKATLAEAPAVAPVTRTLLCQVPGGVNRACRGMALSGASGAVPSSGLATDWLRCLTSLCLRRPAFCLRHPRWLPRLIRDLHSGRRSGNLQ